VTERDGAVRLHVVVPARLLAKLDARTGPRARSAFVVEAIEEKLEQGELDQEERLRIFDEMAGSLANVDVPGWETPEATSAWVRALREESDRRIADAWADRE